MAKLISTKVSKAEREAAMQPRDYTEPEYPWGMRIRVEKELFKKLGLGELPDSGTKIPIKAVLLVEENWSRQHADGDDKGFAGVICEIALDQEDEKPAASRVMYGGE